MNGDVLMRRVAEAFEMADLRPLFDAIDDKIVWKSAVTTTGTFGFGGVYRNRAGVVQLTTQVISAYNIERLRPKEIIESGNTVWGLFNVEGEFRPSVAVGRFKCDYAVRWRLRRGKIVEHQGFVDTHALLQQQMN
ncbi:MAG TPA: nuclear transport factor 2 family protein [Stellaceae bacterium]|nr:nuclear transport factor 2 family protein [Stellaceae bacterium]